MTPSLKIVFCTFLNCTFKKNYYTLKKITLLLSFGICTFISCTFKICAWHHQFPLSNQPNKLPLNHDIVGTMTQQHQLHKVICLTDTSIIIMVYMQYLLYESIFYCNQVFYGKNFLMPIIKWSLLCQKLTYREDIYICRELTLSSFQSNQGFWLIYIMWT